MSFNFKFSRNQKIVTDANGFPWSLCMQRKIVMGFEILGLDFVVSQMMNCHKSTISLLGGERLGFFFQALLIHMVLWICKQNFVTASENTLDRSSNKENFDFFFSEKDVLLQQTSKIKTVKMQLLLGAPWRCIILCFLLIK